MKHQHLNKLYDMYRNHSTIRTEPRNFRAWDSARKDVEFLSSLLERRIYTPQPNRFEGMKDLISSFRDFLIEKAMANRSWQLNNLLNDPEVHRFISIIKDAKVFNFTFTHGPRYIQDNTNQGVRTFWLLEDSRNFDDVVTNYLIRYMDLEHAHTVISGLKLLYQINGMPWQ